MSAAGTLSAMNTPLASDPAKLERHDAILSAAQRALAGASLPFAELGDTHHGTPASNDHIPIVKVPDAPRVASRTSPGVVPMKTKGFGT